MASHRLAFCSIVAARSAAREGTFTSTPVSALRLSVQLLRVYGLFLWLSFFKFTVGHIFNEEKARIGEKV